MLRGAGRGEGAGQAEQHDLLSGEEVFRLDRFRALFAEPIERRRRNLVTNLDRHVHTPMRKSVVLDALRPARKR